MAEKVSRIIYVEPNDVFGNTHTDDSNGHNLTIPYEDLCIAFNLIVENYPRYRSGVSSPQSRDRSGYERNTALLQWFFNRNETTTSFLGGTFNDGAGNSYLTTYYTDISYDSYGDQSDRQIVEGLGVENIQITFESWYTPTITIKFVDVRGSSLWGNEEAIHHNNKITANNIFGSFFTFPYPKFRLQVKGFLGKPVTFQMTCSSFKGKYNAQTGNFEAIVQFVGYTYSLLTDIPLEYLVAAPFCDSYGKEYWEGHVNSEAWALDDGTPPPTMFSFFHKIEQAQPQKKDGSGITEEETERQRAISEERKLLYSIKDEYLKFVNILTEQAQGKFESKVGEENKQVLYFFNGGTSENDVTSPTLDINIATSTQNIFERLVEAVDKYNETFTTNSIPKSNLPNRWSKCPEKIVATRLYNIEKDERNRITKVSLFGLEGRAKTVSNVKNIKMNDRRTMVQSIASDVFHSTFTPYSDQIANYGFILEFYGFEKLINDKLDALKDEETKIIKAVAERQNNRIKDIVGFKPYIGNVFKMIMCHLETFVHIMFGANSDMLDQAKEGKRTPSYLNVNSEDTDVVDLGPNGSLPPWPLVLNQGVVEEDGGEQSSDNVQIGWVGDFSHNFLEEKVVLDIQASVRHLVEMMHLREEKKSFTVMPIIPYDFFTAGSPFFTTQENVDISSVAGYMAMRATQILGIMNDNTINSDMMKLLGEMDAYNYISGANTVDGIKSELFNKLNGDNFANAMTSIALCDSNYDMFGKTFENTDMTGHAFETVSNTKFAQDTNGLSNKRHPMLTEKGGSYHFSHYYTDKLATIVPTELKKYTRYGENLATIKNGNDVHFKPLYYDTEEGQVAKEWMHLSDSSFINGLEGDEVNDYVNKSMFCIIDDESMISAIYNKHGELKNSNFKVAGHLVDSDFTDFLAKYWHIDDEVFAKFFSKNDSNLSRRRESLGVDEETLFPLNITAETDFSKVDFSTSNKWMNGDVVSYTEENCCVQQFTVYENSTSVVGSLFGSPFYYMQNNKKTDEEDGDYQIRRRNVKALLLLHTLKYDYSEAIDAFRQSKHNGTIQCVPYGYLLFLGGLLWRNRYIEQYNDDPIIYKEGTYEYKSAYQGGKQYTFFNKANDGYKCIFTKANNTSNDCNYNVEVSSMFGNTGNGWKPDLNIQNQLIKMFEKFASKDFSKISSEFELKRNEFTMISSTISYVTDYKCKTFVEDLYNFSKVLGSKIGNAPTSSTVGGFNNYSLQTIPEYAQWNVVSFSSDMISEGNFDMLLGKANGFTNWQGKYRMLTITNKDYPYILNMLMEESNDLQDTFIDLYRKKYIVCDASYRRMGNKSATGTVSNDDIVYIPKNHYLAYANGFIGKLKTFVDELDTPNPGDNPNLSEKFKADRNYCIAIYQYLKNLWDRWLLSANENDFDVDPFFRKNFFFIDSYYVNTYNKLPINCNNLLDRYHHSISTEPVNGSYETRTLFNFLNDIISDNRCMFICVPDYIGFGSKEHDTKTLQDVFKPMPFNEMPAPSLNNKFLIIYTHKPSEVANENGAFKYDGFDIWSVANKTEEAPDLFKIAKSEDEENNKRYQDIQAIGCDDITRYGYNVPAFGVAMNRQNQHVFKNINVDMNNPVVTDQAIKAYANILQLGKSGERRVAFHGQDIYPIYSAYSYQCEVEMIGNAQIVPLMYFQLFNIPMWRGSYMIFHVNHTITPGDMTTTFKGTKMSSRPMPFGSTFFSDINDFPMAEDMASNGGGSSDGAVYNTSVSDGVNLESSYNKAEGSVDKNSYFYQAEYRSGTIRDVIKGKTPDSNLIRLFNQLVDEIKQLPENREKQKWTISLTNVLRDSGVKPDGSPKSKSDHEYFNGHAMDIGIRRFDATGNKSTPISSAYARPELLKVFDIVYENHFDQVRQAILEYKPREDFAQAGTITKFNCLHLATVYSSSDKHEFFIGGYTETKNNNGTNFDRINKNQEPSWFTSHAPASFKEIARKHYNKNRGCFRAHFTNFESFEDSDLTSYFGGSSNSTTNNVVVDTGGKKIYFQGNDAVDVIKKWWCSWEGNLDLTKPYTYSDRRWGVSSYCGIQGVNFNPTKKKYDYISEAVYMEALDKVINGVDSSVKTINNPALKLVGYTCCLWGPGATKHLKRKYGGSLKSFAQKVNSNTDAQNRAMLEEIKQMIISEYKQGNIVPKDHWGDNEKGRKRFEESKGGTRRRWNSINYDYVQLNL